MQSRRLKKNTKTNARRFAVRLSRIVLCLTRAAYTKIVLWLGPESQNRTAEVARKKNVEPCARVCVRVVLCVCMYDREAWTTEKQVLKKCLTS